MDLAAIRTQITNLDRANQHAEALKIAGQAVSTAQNTLGKQDPAFAEALLLLGEVHYMMDSLDQAKDVYLWALNLNTYPDRAHLLNRLAAVYLDLSHHEQAQKHLDAAAGLSLDEAEQVRLWDNQGRLALMQGRWAEAGTYLQQALKQRQQTRHAQHPDLALSLRHLAQWHEYRGTYQEAEPLYTQAFRVRLGAYAKKHPLVAQSLADLGQVYHTLARYPDAESLYEQARAAVADGSGRDTLRYASLLDRLAALYQDLSRYADAEPLYREALAIREKQRDDKHAEFAASLDRLARLQHSQGDYDNAKGTQQWALDLKRQALGDRHPDVAASLDNLGRIWQALADYDRAETQFTEALNIRRETLDATHPLVAASQNNLGALYQAMGLYSQAYQPYRDALKIRQDALGATHPAVADSLHDLAALLRMMDDDHTARNHYDQALKLRQTAYGPDHPLCADSLHGLARLDHRAGNFEAARQRLTDVRRIREDAFGTERPVIAETLNDLAEALTELQQYNKAEPLYLQAHQIWQQTQGQKHPDFGRSLHNLADLYHRQGEFNRARGVYQWALDIRREALGETHPDVALTTTRLAATYTALDMHPNALTDLNKASGINDQMIGQVFAIGSERQRQTYLRGFRENFNLFLSFVTQHNPTAVEPALTMVLRRKGLGAEALTAQRDAIAQRYPDLQPKLQQLNNLRQTIAQTLMAGSSDTYQDQLATWHRQRDELEADLAHDIPEMNLSAELQHVTIATLQAALPADAALVEVVRYQTFNFKAVVANNQPAWGQDAYLAFVIRPNQPPQMIQLGPAADINALVMQVRQHITNKPEPTDEINQTSRAAFRKKSKPVPPDTATDLRAKLFDPLQTALGDATQLLICPDGKLSRLPWGILPLNDTQRLIDRYPIRYLSAARDWLRLTERANHPSNAPLVIANPDFNLDAPTSGKPFSKLAHTRTEGQNIAAKLGVTPKMGANARRDVITACCSPRILHIATHGFFLPHTDTPIPGGRIFELATHNNPMLRSGLAFAGANAWNANQPHAEDAILTAENVSALDLLGTELVVLSACETGLGDLEAGEGVFGLRRAFVLAGAQTLVMSLWEVPDRETQMLMDNFYTRIIGGEPPAEALQAAQRDLKNERPNPMYWGAFICQGK